MEASTVNGGVDRLAALQASGAGTFSWDLRTNTVASDRNLDRLFALRPRRSARPLDEFLTRVHPDDRQRVSRRCERCAQDGTDFDEEYRTQWPDESVHWLHGKGKVFRDSSGRSSHVTGICVDITRQRAYAAEARKRYEKLRESEARLQALVAASPLGIVIMDLQGQPVYYNPRCEELHGLGLSAAQGAGWVDALHPADRKRILASWSEAAAAGRPWSKTYRFLHADGRIVWVIGRAAPMLVDGKQIGFVGTLEDITSLKLAEEALRRSEARLRRVSDSGMVGVFYWTTDWRITDANDRFLQMLGYGREQLTAGALRLDKLTPQQWWALEEIKLGEVMQRGVASPWEKELYTSDGRTAPVLMVAAALDDEGGIAICVDNSERKQAEEARNDLLGRERNARLQAERAARQREEVMSAVAHDLRNPLHIFTLILHRLQTAPPSDPRHAAREFALLQRAANSMEALTRDLLDVSRIESGTFAVEKRPVQMTELLNNAVELFEMAAREAKISLSCDIAKNARTAIGDHARLTQVLWNLLGNALRHTPAQGRIIVRARRHGGFVHMSVADTGTGIPPEHLQHLFDRFWQLERTSGVGAGLGLAIARGIVESHGGRIKVRSIVGRGTVLHFTIPCSPA